MAKILIDSLAQREDEDKKYDLPPCKWWQKLAASVESASVNYSVTGGAGLGLGGEVKLPGGGQIGLRAEVVKKFTYDYWSNTSTLGESANAIGNVKLGPLNLSGGDSWDQFHRVEFVNNQYGVPIPEAIDYVPLHHTVVDSTSFEAGAFSQSGGEFTLSATAVFLKGGITFNADRYSSYKDQLLTEKYKCDPSK